MTIYEEVKKHLEETPSARERSQKNHFVAWLLYKKWSLSVREMTIPVLEQIIVESSSYDRAWRQVLQLEPHLRGTDYESKTDLEMEKRKELGY
jgi:hypothetical protein